MISRLRSGGSIAVLIGLMSFLIAFGSLTALTAPPQAVVGVPVPVPEVTLTPPGSIAAQAIAPEHVAVGLAIVADQALLFDTHVGDRLDVLAIVPGQSAGNPVAAVVVSGASILKPPPSAEQAALLLEVTPSDAQTLAHLVGLGVPLTYALWSERGRPAIVPPIDARAALASLGLAPTPNPTPVVVATPSVAEPTQARAPALATPTELPASPVPVSTPAPESTPRPAVYTVRAGDTLASIANQFNVDFTALAWANRRLPNSTLLPGTEIFLPDYRGRMYDVRPGDTWDGLERSLGYSPEILKQINELPAAAPLEAGMQLFVPTGL